MNLIKKNKDFILDVVIIFVGCFIASIGVNLFLSHAKLLSGGATGITLILEYITNFPSGVSVFLINVPLFLLSYKKLSRTFTLYSAIGMTSLSISLLLTKQFSTIIQVDDILLYCLYGGALCGIGYGLVFLRNGSTGGTDIITMLIRQKHSNFKIGSVGFSLNCAIVILGALIFQELYILLYQFSLKD